MQIHTWFYRPGTKYNESGHDMTFNNRTYVTDDTMSHDIFTVDKFFSHELFSLEETLDFIEEKKSHIMVDGSYEFDQQQLETKLEKFFKNHSIGVICFG